MQPEISERIFKGNRKFKTFKIKIVKKSTKTKMYLMLMRPVVTYASEIWTLNEHDKNRLRKFER
jgi:hypothetical protein